MTQPQVLPKHCTARVRRAAAAEQCLVTLNKGRCPNNENHIWPIPTGWCNSGWHEGHKVPFPTCKVWINCPCECHEQLSRMAAMTGTERYLIDNSTYVPDRGGFVRVSLTDHLVEKVTSAPTVRVLDSPSPGLVPQIIERDFSETPSGRAAKGQLEVWVREVTDIWMVEGDTHCTPQYVSEKIASIQGFGKGPSTGAIDAVFRRWTVIGFAHIESKPTRFIGYTMDGIKLGLEVMKAKAKRR